MGGIKEGKEGTDEEVLEWSEVGRGTKKCLKKHCLAQKA